MGDPVTNAPGETAADEAATTATSKDAAATLLLSIFMVAACGLIYELLIATVSTYLLGSSVTQFSVSVGVFIGSMGLGSHLSQRVRKNLLERFVAIEIALALVGGCSSFLLFLSFSYGFFYSLVLYPLLVTIGMLVGLELPILTRQLRTLGSLRRVLAQALSFDYLGALVGSLLLPLLLIPTLGLMRTAFAAGLVNAFVALWNVRVFKRELKGAPALAASAMVVIVLLGCGFAWSLRLVDLFESRLYDQPIILARQTPYQRIVITQWAQDTRLYLDGHLQFSSQDEYRYHESLIHPAASLCGRCERALLLGGGDGLGVRELLKYPGIREVVLVDIDPEVTQLGQEHPALLRVNQGALNNARVRVVNDDAFSFLKAPGDAYDLIVADLPDPNSEVLAKLYSREFYGLALRRLTAQGVFVTQATSPHFGRDAFWCIHATMRAAGLKTLPFQVYVPSFGPWGFVMGAARELDQNAIRAAVTTRFLNEDALREMFLFGKDIGAVPVEISTLDHPRVFNYYVQGWEIWSGPPAKGGHKTGGGS